MKEPGLSVIYQGIQGVRQAPDDLEDSLLVALTRKDMQLVSFGLWWIVRVLPELNDDAQALALSA